MTTLFPGLPDVIFNKNLELARRHGCQVCPLANQDGFRALSQDMPATGVERPLIYILGEAPGGEEDKQNEQFVGKSGLLLRANIPRKFRDKLRFNNVVRTRPKDNRDPVEFEIECCRPSVARDIEQSKPKAIFGFGNIPLSWLAPGWSGIKLWRGRRMPVKVGTHTCWYYPIFHPAFMLRIRRDDKPSEDERMFVFDVKRAFADVDAGLPKPVVHNPADVFKNMQCITEGGAVGLRIIEDSLRWAAAQSDLGIDYETNRLRPYGEDARILTVAVDNGHEGFAFPFEHPEASWSKDDLDDLYALWQDFLRSCEARKWVHNLAFEHEWTGVKFGRDKLRIGEWHDTASQACIIDERVGKNKPGCFSLEFLVQQYFGFNIKKLSNLDRNNLAAAPLPVVLRYNGGDARYHCLLGLEQEQVIAREGKGLKNAYKLQLRRVPTVVLTQMNGVPVDQKECKRLHKKYDDRYEEVKNQILKQDEVKKYEQQYGRFNPMSNKNVLTLLNKVMKRSEIWVTDKYNGTQKTSVDKKVLDLIDRPVARLLVDLRESNKRDSTYVLPLMKGAEESVLFDDDLLHAIFNTFFAETGRLSCEWPNLQNFPKRDGEAKEVRRQIVAPPGCVIVAFDYGQIEARVIAMFTKDKKYVKALWENYDIHMEWAERLARAYPARIGGINNIKDPKVMKVFRGDVKNQWTFPLFFGARMESVAGYLQIPEERVRPEFDRFWNEFSTTADWQEEQIKFYQQYGYVEGLTGRRRRGPLSKNKICNSPVQGTAAEIVMDGMCRLSETGDPFLQPDINIHDDLTFVRVPLNKVDYVAEKVIDTMLRVPFPWVNVPITVEMAVGDNWLEMEELSKEQGGSVYSSADWFK